MIPEHSRFHPDPEELAAVLTGHGVRPVDWTAWLRLDAEEIRLGQARGAERIKVAADTLRLRPSIRRLDGHTQILLGASDGDSITDGEVTLAARIEDAYRTVVSSRD